MMCPDQLIELVAKEDKGQRIYTLRCGSEPMGHVVIDSTVSGSSCGGVRMVPDVDEAEIRRLARTMTLKYGFLGLPQGGAKAGVRWDPEANCPERRRGLAAFGRGIAPLLRNRAFVPAPDMGTRNADIRYMLEEAGVRLKRRELRATDPGYYTALTVFICAVRAMRHLGMSPSGSRVAIEGFGRVGSALAGLLASANTRLVGISTSRGAIYNPRGLDVNRLLELTSRTGSRVVDRYDEAERIERAALLEVPVDLLSPCARHHTIHAGNAGRIAARIVCPGANDPVTPEAEGVLFKRGIMCLPDFVSNSGGVLGGTMEFASLSRERIAAFMERHMGACVERLLEEALRQGVPPREIAAPRAQRRFEEVRRRAQHPTLVSRFFGLGLELYRRGWLPGSLVARLSPPYFERSLA